MQPLLTFQDYIDAGQKIDVDPCFIAAVAFKETKENRERNIKTVRAYGFLKDDRVKIRFETHVFHRELRAKGITISTALPGGASYKTFNAAFALDPTYAMRATSWGLFQIMGFNHEKAGFPTVAAFVDAMKESEQRQLDIFCTFAKRYGLLPAMRAHDYAAFARKYNGPRYAENKYDTELRQFHENCKNGAFPCLL